MFDACVGHANTAAFRNAYRNAQHDSHQQLSDIDAELAGIVSVHCVLGIDIRRHATGLLGFRHDVQGQRRLAGALRSINLDDAPARNSAHADCRVEAERGGGNCRNVRHLALTQAHN